MLAGQNCLHTRVPHATLRCAPTDKKAYPVEIGLLRLEAIVHVPNSLANLIEQAGGLQQRRAGFHEKFIPVYLSSIRLEKPTGKRVAGIFKKVCIVTSRMYRPGFDVYITLGFFNERYL